MSTIVITNNVHPLACDPFKKVQLIIKYPVEVYSVKITSCTSYVSIWK